MDVEAKFDALKLIRHFDYGWRGRGEGERGRGVWGKRFQNYCQVNKIERMLKQMLKRFAWALRLQICRERERNKQNLELHVHSHSLFFSSNNIVFVAFKLTYWRIVVNVFFENGRHLDILLFIFKLDLDASFKAKYSFEF